MAPIITTHIINTFSALEDTGCNPNKTFFGLPVWYKYLNVKTTTGGCNFSGFSFFTSPGGAFAPDSIFLILLAILDDLLVIAGIVAVAFVIYGAIQLITSQAEPEKVAHARGTVLNALIGLVIAMSAAVFVNFLGNSLGGG